MRMSGRELPEGTSEDPASRERRIEEIRKKIEEGTYDIDLRLLAERILEEEILPEE